MGFRTWAREHLLTADAIYGLILYSALVAGVSDDETSALEVLVWSVGTIVIFWAAHVFSRTLAGHGPERSLGRAIWEALDESSGMLYAAVIPSIPLGLAALNVIAIDDAVDLCLLIAMIVLGVLGASTLRARGAPRWMRVLGGIGTAFFGFTIIVLNVIVH